MRAPLSLRRPVTGTDHRAKVVLLFSVFGKMRCRWRKFKAEFVDRDVDVWSGVAVRVRCQRHQSGCGNRPSSDRGFLSFGRIGTDERFRDETSIIRKL